MTVTVKRVTVKRAATHANRVLWAGVFGYAGAMHFKNPRAFEFLVPRELPGERRDWVYGSGAAELALSVAVAGSLANSVRGKESAAYNGVVANLATAFLLAVWPGNMLMAWKWRNHKFKQRAIAFARVPAQVPMMMMTWLLR